MATDDKSDDKKSLILKWLTQWRDQSRQHGSKLEYVYGKALKTLREHPHPISSCDDCKKLKNFGPKICEKINKEFTKLNNTGDDRLLSKTAVSSQQYSPKRTLTDILPVAVRPKRPLICTPKQSANIFAKNSPPVKITKTATQRNVKNWVPTPGQTPFAILVALLRRHLEFDDSRVNKLDLQDMAELYTTTRPLILTAALNSLIHRRQLVDKTSDRNARYFLTDSGRKLAIQLAKQCPMLKDFVARFLNDKNNLITNYFETRDCTESIQTPCQNFILEAGTYDIVLCIDTRERYSDRNGTQSRTAFPVALQQKGILIEIRTLPLGDFVWIAREKIQTSTDSNNQTIVQQQQHQKVRRELVLDYIIERKRIDDLASSIKGHRWNEQKFRLRNSGIRNPMYLIEYFGKKSRKQDHGYLSAATLEQAISNCEIDGFEIKLTDSFDETVRYLANMSRSLQCYYQNKSLLSCQDKKQLGRTCAKDFVYMTFNEFVTNSSKITIFTAKEMFIKHLLQIRGLSMKKVETLIKKFPTIRSLFQAYSMLKHDDDSKRENLLTNLKCDSLSGTQDRRLGPVLSKKINYFYN
ncbi:Crossover junction endonuclease mus81 [Dermatophagoides farinae]|uniref:Crossover junction endonuclease MUS81 n=1 Tax=Dermatophagoides farinae TaxID=6954 RepID=A0A922I8I5_DERFA|nr:Crossover junction endonuclease mus81 [Dermatophagoides farinae]